MNTQQRTKWWLLLLGVLLLADVYQASAFYDPNLQRWLNRDPLGDMQRINSSLSALIKNKNLSRTLPPFEILGEPNLYTYIENNSPNHTDPFGLQSATPCKNPPDCPSQWEDPPGWFKKHFKNGACLYAKMACQASCNTADIDCTIACAADCDTRWRLCMGMK